VSGSLIERVRERLAAESAPLGSPLGPAVVAAAIRAGSGGMLGDTEVLANLRVLQTELTGAGILEPLLRADGTTDVLVTAPDAVWVDDGNGLRRTLVRFTDEATVRRLAQRLALTAAGAIETQAAALLDDIIAARLAFVVCGGTGAGKTTPYL
jgi:pilus assembly protein CpaF